MAIALIVLSVVIILLLFYIISLVNRRHDEGEQKLEKETNDIFIHIEEGTSNIKDAIKEFDIKNKFEEFERKEGMISHGKMVTLYKVTLSGTKAIKHYVMAPLPYMVNHYELKTIPISLERYFSDKIEAIEFTKKILDDEQYTITDNDTTTVEAFVKE